MLGKRSKQLGLFESDQLYLEFVGTGSFYGYLASQRNQIFIDEDFAEMSCADNGRHTQPNGDSIVVASIYQMKKPKQHGQTMTYAGK